MTCMILYTSSQELVQFVNILNNRSLGVPNILQIVGTFQQISGLKLNIDKAVAKCFLEKL